MKYIYIAIIMLFQAFYVAAQCPTSIAHDGTDGTVYYLTLADGNAECANYTGDITINSVTYKLANCDADNNEVEYTIEGGNSEVIIATDAPITMKNGALTCIYDAAGSFVALPVELLHFTATQKENTVLLDWATASELGNAGFEVQRSANGKTFETLTFVEGNGTTIEQQNYDYKDLQPLDGVSYYRLKQIDFNGQFEYSDIRTVELEVQEEVQIYPNPVQDKLTVQNVENVETVIIYNAFGQVVKQLSVVNYPLSIDTNDLLIGIYMLQLQKTNGTIITKQFVK